MCRGILGAVGVTRNDHLWNYSMEQEKRDSTRQGYKFLWPARSNYTHQNTIRAKQGISQSPLSAVDYPVFMLMAALSAPYLSRGCRLW